jgi:c-di-GMP-binding flagellar brake protein YcgR
MDEAKKANQREPQGAERREMPRVAVDDAATLALLSDGTTLSCRLLDLSLGGCRMLMLQRLPKFVHEGVEVSFKVQGIAFRLSGRIQWTNDSNEIGLSFGPMSPRRRNDLLEVLSELEARDAVRARAAGLEPLPAGQSSPSQAQPSPAEAQASPAGVQLPAAKEKKFRPLDAIFRKIFYPRAAPEKENLAQGNRSVAPGRAQPAASEPKLQEAAAIERPQDERRADPRWDVGASAVITLVKIGSRLAGHILDLSQGGCRIRTVEKFPVGIYTRIEIEFRLQGTPLLLGGVIQAVHARNQVGIRFLDMSARKQEQLAELIKEMKALGLGGGDEA